ncbi:hypothetical protein A0H81_00333 [Grifola frondosa]|uniref:Uncharacterized protein n=1 Tax=Grifola frondosa TaxID=5627 RepID=A0A1C7MSJ3_GRIFR|nr:hypothetical protein A0H81_00333 [Grifola frondosa]
MGGKLDDVVLCSLIAVEYGQALTLADLELGSLNEPSILGRSCSNLEDDERTCQELEVTLTHIASTGRALYLKPPDSCHLLYFSGSSVIPSGYMLTLLPT